MNRQLSTLISKFNIVGAWEYNPLADKMRLCPTASRIYFGNSNKVEVDIGELFGALSPKSSQQLSRVLSSRVKGDTVFSQYIYTLDLSLKEVMVIVKVEDDKAYGITIDVMSG